MSSTRSLPRTRSPWSRREAVDGYPTILAVLEPRRDYKARTDEGKMMKKIRARAWIHETEYQIVRVEIEALQDIGVGLGVIGKLYKGTVGEFERTKVNGEVWLPARARFTAKGRALFRKFAIDSVIGVVGLQEVFGLDD